MRDINLIVDPFAKKYPDDGTGNKLPFAVNLTKGFWVPVLLFILSISIGVLIATTNLTTALVTLASIFAIPAVYVIFAYPRAGIVMMLVFAFFLAFIARFSINFPLGTVIDATVGLLLLGFLFRQKQNPEWKIYRNSISIIILVWVGYNILQVANPVTESRLAWLYTVRTVAFVMLSYYIFLYYLRNINFIRFIFKLWIAISVFAALYGLKQEFFGFFGFEQAYLDADPALRDFLFINGQWRKFSIFTDPASYSYNMVIISIVCFAFLWGPYSKGKKFLLTCLIFLFLSAMLYSGTRGAFVLLPAALFLFGILKFTKKVLLLMVAAGLLFGFLIFVPTSNYTLYRFQTAFKPSTDASYLLRKENQKKIQPYIQSHPLGGGLGATGVWGRRFSPDSFLANFPPDSGYVRVAVELGWVGLFIFCCFMFIALKTGIDNYYRIRDPELKTYCLAMVLMVFALNLGNYPQEALVQYPINILFCMALALINITLLLDKKSKPQELNSSTQFN
jgi:putative inorganic carbon (hco3(-)) transporter